MTLEDVVPKEALEAEWETGSKRKKRQLDDIEPDEEEALEATDTVQFIAGNSSSTAIVSGRNKVRRVSGFYRELKSLNNIGQNTKVMELVFDRMAAKDVMAAGVVCSMWNTILCRRMRKKFGSSSFLRLWHEFLNPRYLWIDFELHYHAELLVGSEEDAAAMDIDQAKTERSPVIPAIQAILSVGSRTAFQQYVHDLAKLPYRQDHIFAISGQAVITAPNYTFISTADDKFRDEMVIESLFVPKSDKFTLKGFCVEVEKEDWSIDEVKGKLELPEEDTGPGQKLQALLLITYYEFESLKKFLNTFNQCYKSVQMLSGLGEEIGFNRTTSNLAAVGYSFYTGPGAEACVYVIDFLKDDSMDLLNKMQAQLASAANGFCFVFTHDSRSPKEPESPNDSWAESTQPKSETPVILAKILKVMPKLQLLGVDTLFPVGFKNPNHTNTDENSPNQLTYGFLMLTFN